MIRCALAAAAATTVLASAPAHAADASSKTATTAVSAEVQQSCSFTSTPPTTQSVTPTAGEKDLGYLGYTCNFVGNANLTLSLPNGTNFYNPSNGGDTQSYGIRWTIPPNGSGTGYQVLGAGSIPFGWPTASSANAETKGMLSIKLDRDLPVAGTYTTTITYTIPP